MQDELYCAQVPSGIRILYFLSMSDSRSDIGFPHFAGSPLKFDNFAIFLAVTFVEKIGKLPSFDKYRYLSGYISVNTPTAGRVMYNNIMLSN